MAGMPDGDPCAYAVAWYSCFTKRVKCQIDYDREYAERTCISYNNEEGIVAGVFPVTDTRTWAPVAFQGPNHSGIQINLAPIEYVEALRQIAPTPREVSVMDIIFKIDYSKYVPKSTADGFHFTTPQAMCKFLEINYFRSDERVYIAL